MSEPVTAQIADNEKVQLKGPNGSGKSSWLRALLGNLSLLDGEIKVNTPLFYLDQHFGVVQDDFLPGTRYYVYSGTVICYPTGSSNLFNSERISYFRARVGEKPPTWI